MQPTDRSGRTLARAARGVHGAMDRRRLEGCRVLTDATARVRKRAPVGTVALTFDDGPNPGSTDVILDVLGELEVRATFFCVGRNAVRHPDLVRRILEEGHSVGSHSNTHPHPRSTPLRTLTDDYARGRTAVTEALGEHTRLFRPPHGHVSVPAAVALRRTDVSTWLWTVDPEDWRPGVTADRITEVASRASSTDVVLLHDWVEQPLAAEALDRSATVAALPGVVTAIRSRGLDLVGLDQ